MTHHRPGYWLERFAQVAVHSNTEGVEFFFCVLKLSWGVFLLPRR